MLSLDIVLCLILFCVGCLALLGVLSLLTLLQVAGLLRELLKETQGRRSPDARSGAGLRSSILLLLSAGGVFASSPAEAALASHKDALHLPAHERIYYRYLWWPRGWDHTRLLTKAQQSLLSDQGKFPEPAYIGQGVFRLDTRESGWEKRLQVWERFAKTDIYFHSRFKFQQDAVVKVYFPPGFYGDKKYGPTSEDRKVKAGDTLDRPALFANPWVDVGVDSKGRAQDELRRLLNTEVPIVNGPWFLIQTQRQISIRNVNEQTGYHDFLGIKNRNDVFSLAGLNEKVAIERFAEWRALVEKSGISQQNRQIVLLRGATGLIWGTLDTFREQGRGVAKRNLRRGEFDHDAEEWIFHLPSGVPGTALVTAKDIDAAKQKAGDLVDSAPDKIGPDDSGLNISRDGRVHENLSCWRCHGVDRDFVKPFDDWARRTYRRNKAVLRDPDKKVALELESNYLRDVERLASIDRQEYAHAVAQMTSTGEGDPGLTVAGFARIYGEAWNKRVVDRVTLDVASDDLGASKDRFKGVLQKRNDFLGKSDPVLGAFLENATLSWLEWEDSYAYAQALVNGLAVPEIEIEDKKKGKP